MDPLLGQIQLFPYASAPYASASNPFIFQGWSLCDGRLIPIKENPALYSLMGNTFGGDGVSTFALPNLNGKEPLPGMRYYIAVQGTYPARE